MVEKKIIEYAITKSILVNKCSVTLTQIKESISSTIKKLSDNDEEYNKLMDTIPKFYRDHYNLDHEELYVQGYDGKEYINTEGDDGSVSVPMEVAEKGYKNGILLAYHNHPDASCIQSIGDFQVCGSINEKYMITVAKDGIMITKNTGWDSRGTRASFLGAVRAEYEQPIVEMFYNEPKWGFQELQQGLRDGSISQEEANKKGTKILNDYYSENMPNVIKGLQSKFNEYDADITVAYVPI